MSSELNAYVREVAEFLVTEFEQGREETRNWGDTRTAIKLVGRAADTCLASLSATNISGKATLGPSGELWNVAGEWLERGELINRAYSKPRGYAGDYRMLEQIYRNYQCSDALGKVLDAYFQRQDAPKAVRNRTELAADWIARHVKQSQGGSYQIVSVGCGPAIDLELALKKIDEAERGRVQLSLLDLDEEALVVARQRLARNSHTGKDPSRPLRGKCL